MDPSFLLLRVHLGPYVIFSVPYPSDAASDRTTEHTEAVGPFAAAPTPRLQEGPDITVAGEAFESAAFAGRTAVQFDARCASGPFLGGGGCHSKRNGWSSTDRTWRIIDEAEEYTLEPSRDGVRSDYSLVQLTALQALT